MQFKTKSVVFPLDTVLNMVPEHEMKGNYDDVWAETKTLQQTLTEKALQQIPEAKGCPAKYVISTSANGFVVEVGWIED